VVSRGGWRLVVGTVPQSPPSAPPASTPTPPAKPADGGKDYF